MAGGTGSRLMPLTKITNKHLLPVWKKLMIYYPLEKFRDAGIKEVLIVTGKEHAGDFIKILGNGKEFGMSLTYGLQEEAGGIAQALSLANNFLKYENKFAVILGDNILEDDIRKDVADFEKGKEEAHIFLKKVKDARRFGVAELKGDEVVGIEEKPEKPKTDYAVTGLYLYSNNVFEIIRTLKPSKRGELEISDVNNDYIQKGTIKATILSGFWTDAGTFESLFRATKLLRDKEERDK